MADRSAEEHHEGRIVINFPGEGVAYELYPPKPLEKNKSNFEGGVRVRHLSECYLLNYPDDEGVHCTCDDWSPEI